MEQKPKIIAIIQARMSSTRLPGKALLNLCGKTVLERVLERVSKSKLLDEAVVATTTAKSDDAIIELLESTDYRFFRGSMDDVLDRYFKAANKFDAEHIVRITADCPLIDPEIIDLVIERHLKSGADYTGNTLTLSYPDGLDVEVFSFLALQNSAENATLKSEREHVTQFMKKFPSKFKQASVEHEIDLSNKRWTLDNQEDYEFIAKIYEALSNEGKIFKMQDILNFLKTRPEFEKINSHIRANEGLAKSLEEDRKAKS